LRKYNDLRSLIIHDLLRRRTGDRRRKTEVRRGISTTSNQQQET
jgi:hypothetical protein